MNPGTESAVVGMAAVFLCLAPPVLVWYWALEGMRWEVVVGWVFSVAWVAFLSAGVVWAGRDQARGQG